jgi:predicted transcriptional regulator
VDSLSSEEMVVSGEVALEVADALNSTTLRMLQILSKEHLDVSTIAQKLGLSEAYISEQVTLLEKLKLLKVNYEKGRRGTRKICATTIRTITIVVESKI